MLRLLLLLLPLLSGHALSANPYKPVLTDCPSSPLVRDADGLNSKESEFINARAPKAAAALQSWLQKAAPDIKASKSNFPVLGLTTSGGGLRSLLTGAGVHKAFDERDSDVSTSGLYQALTYESGLSGGAWLLGSLAGNNWPTVSSLQSSLWNQAFDDTIANPPHFGQVQINIGLALLSKKASGYDIGVTDIYGRLLGYQLLSGKAGGIDAVLSDLASLGNFTSHNVPYPIITALNTPIGRLLPPFQGKQMEFHPYEFGSWDNGIAAFTPTEYLGSILKNGKPTNSSTCITRYDNQGFILGTSSSIFSALVQAGAKSAPEVQQLVAALKLLGFPTKTNDIYFAQFPNPFYQYSSSSAVQDQEELNLVDGGDNFVDQGDPIWPMLYRDVDVLFVSANSGDTINNFPSGVEIHNTYRRAQQEGLKNMPEIPDASVFKSKGLSNRTVFFGCDEDNAMTIVYLPNRKITYNSGKSTLQLKYTPAQTADMIKNGMAIATEDDDAQYGSCLACGVMKKVKGVTLPNDCDACLKKYCYPSSGLPKGSSNGGSNNGGSNNGGGNNGGGSNGGSNNGGGNNGGGSNGGSNNGGGSNGGGSNGGGSGGGNAGSRLGGGLNSALAATAALWALRLFLF